MKTSLLAWLLVRDSMQAATRGICLTACLTAGVVAQQAGPGLTWSGALGGFAGSFQPTCTSLPANAIRGDNIDLRVWGDTGALFVLAQAGSTMPCLPIPGIGNGLILAPPAVVVAAGLLTQLTPCLACPPGYESLLFAVPTFLPPGLTISFQAASFGNHSLALTTAITATVQ